MADAGESSGQTRRFTKAGDASKELHVGFNEWSSSLATYGLHAGYAIIGANWAVYGSGQAILENTLAKSSLVVVILFLASHLILTGWMTHLYKERCDYADEDKARWNKEYIEAAEPKSPWPYTIEIEFYEKVMRYLRIWAPVVSGLLFILSLFPELELSVCRSGPT